MSRRSQPLDEIVLEGFHAVKHAARFGATVTKVIVSENANLPRLIDDFAPELEPWFHAHVEMVPAAEFRRTSDRPHPTGVWASAMRPTPTPWANLDAQSPAVIIEDPRNHGNVGSAVRVAAAAGVAGLATIGELDPWSPAALRGSAGLHFALPVLSLPTLPATDRPVFAFDPDGSDLSAIEIPNDAVLIFGSERHGLSDDIKSKADRLVGFPMRPGVSSINLAASVAVGLYHWRLAIHTSGGAPKPLRN